MSDMVKAVALVLSMPLLVAGLVAWWTGEPWSALAAVLVVEVVFAIGVWRGVQIGRGDTERASRTGQ